MCVSICVYPYVRINVWVSMLIQAQVGRFDCQTAARPCAALIELHSGKEDRPLFADFGPGIALHFSSSPPSNRGGMARRQGAWPGLLRDGVRLAPDRGRETSRPAPCGAPTRHLRLTPQSAVGPHQELSVPGGVVPEAARGPGLRKRLPAGCRSRSPLSRRLMKTPSTMDRDGQKHNVAASEVKRFSLER